jgi:predicted ATPase
MLFRLWNVIFLFFFGLCSAEEPSIFKKGADTTMFNNFFILTGGPGSGKTTLIEELNRRGFVSVEEVARKIIQDEMALGEEALPGSNIGSRIEKMIVRSIETYQDALKQRTEPIIFDRGVLDYVGYAYRTNTPISEELHQAALSLVYNKKVFLAPPWEEIYCNDTERKQSFEEALEVYADLFKIYSDFGYEIIELPKASAESRADFVISHMRAKNFNF